MIRALVTQLVEAMEPVSAYGLPGTKDVQQAKPPEATYKLTHDKAAAVAPKIHWLVINERTPINTRMNLIHKPSGVAITGTRTAADHWTHWYPLPTFTE